MAVKESDDNCSETAGRVKPEIDRTRCEGKSDCLRVCPYSVFQLRPLTDAEHAELSWITRFKLFVHGGQQAFAINAPACHACGLCVTACPEKAIKLVKA
jgi:4Fe-4S ferredoxin